MLLMQGMTLVQRVRAVLARAGEPIRAHTVAARAGITTREFNRRAAEMASAGQITRSRRAQRGSGGFWYSLDARQANEARLEAALLEIRGDLIPDLQLGAHDVVGRLGFLRMLKERTVFCDHAIVDLMIADYERCQFIARNQEGEQPQASLTKQSRATQRTALTRTARG